MNTLVDIFNQDAFDLITLTDRVNKQPFAPSKAGKLGIFEEQGITTTAVGIEEYQGTLNLIPTQQRGGPASQNLHQKRKLRNLIVPHLPLEDTIGADEIQNVRAFGTDASDGVLAGVQSVVDLRLMEMNRKHDATVEYGRVGALKGLILDADGVRVIYNLFTEFGVAQQIQDMTLGTAGNLLTLITTVAGLIEDELGAAVYEYLHVFCGKTFWNRFISHPDVKAAYQFFQATGQNMNPLRDDLRYKGFQFGGIVWEQYRGNVGGVPFVPDAEAYVHPIGVPGLFKTYFAPADFVETINTEGLPRYARQSVDPIFGRYVMLHTQSNPLSICTRPRTLIKLITSN